MIFFIYLIYHNFRKINGRIKIFDKCTFGAVAHGGWRPCIAAPGPYRRRARLQEPVVVRLGGTVFF
jgi:hypothetical protein